MAMMTAVAIAILLPWASCRGDNEEEEGSKAKGAEASGVQTKLRRCILLRQE